MTHLKRHQVDNHVGATLFLPQLVHHLVAHLGYAERVLEELLGIGDVGVRTRPASPASTRFSPKRNSTVPAEKRRKDNRRWIAERHAARKAAGPCVSCEGAPVCQSTGAVRSTAWLPLLRFPLPGSILGKPFGVCHRRVGTRWHWSRPVARTQLVSGRCSAASQQVRLTVEFAGRHAHVRAPRRSSAI